MTEKTLWELLWDYDPNGLIVVDPQLIIRVVNPSFCRMFQVERENVLGKPASTVLDDVDILQRVWKSNEVIPAKEKEYPRLDLIVKEVIFPIPAENVIACIMVDITHEWKQRDEMRKIKHETLDKVNQVVDKQMKVAQEIAGLLGETTAETKGSLLKLVEMLKQENY
ncbi:MAG: PAS domain-containing protein [bacterium]